MISIKRYIKSYIKFRRLRSFLHEMNMRARDFVFAGLLSLISAVFNGLSIGLLIPVFKGIVESDFSFIKETVFLKDVIVLLPRWLVSSNTSLFIFLITLIFLSNAIYQILRYFAGIVVSYQVRKAASNMRKCLFESYLNQSKLFFDQKGFGYLNNVLMSFTSRIASEIITLEQAMVTICLLFVYFIMMFMISWRLSIFVLLIVPILYISMRWLMQKIKRTSIDFAKQQSCLNSKSFDILSCIPLVKVYAAEEREKIRFADISNIVQKLEFSLDKKTQAVNPFQEFFILCIMLIMTSAVTFMIVKQKTADISGLLVYFYILKQNASNFTLFGQVQSRLYSISGQIKEVLKLLNKEARFIVKSGNKEFKGLDKEIRFKDLTFSYVNDIIALDKVGFSVPKKSITALVGPTGSGKTTIINLLLRFYDCPPETILLDGKDIRDFNIASLMQHIAFVSQDTLLFNDTLRANISYGLEGVSEDSIMEAVKKARLYDFIKRLPDGLDTIIGDRGTKLSGGEKQRVAIARAILKNAEILIFDEATSALDTRTERLIQEAIEKAAEDKTAIMIAHRLSTIKNADKIVVVEDGRVIEKGFLNDLLAKQGKFYKYWQEQKFY